MFKLQIETGNAAFDEENGGAGEEVARIMREIANKVADGNTSGIAADFNGNTVGRWSLEG